MNKLRSLPLLSIMILALAFPVVHSTEGTSAPETGRSVTIPISVILLGFDDKLVDIGYLGWDGSGKNLPASVTNSILDDGNNTGVVFHPRYSFTLASASFKQDFVRYLRSIETEAHGKNPWFVKYVVDPENPEYFDAVPVTIDYVVYDANSVEEWLWDHRTDVGGFAEDGWTVVLTYLPELPSITWSDVKGFQKTYGDQLPESKPHYYGISSTDADLGYRLRYRDFMNAWGGHHRMWFVDLSAGPVFNSQWEDLPLQVILGDNNIDLLSAFGKNWLNEYLADYIWQATYNFVFPNFVYYPQYSPQYQIDVFIIDDRNSTEKHIVPIEGTVDKRIIETTFRDLLPYSEVSVGIHFSETDQQLHDLIGSSYKYTDSWIMGGVFGLPERYGVVDLRPIYRYMLGSLLTFEPNPDITSNNITVPVFAFALSGETYFTYTYKWQIGKRDWETGALLGMSLKEAVFISLNQWQFTRGDYVDPKQSGKGMGFTQTVIHEVGHSLGLMHPHQYGSIGDFVFSPMGYFTNDYNFGQIDKDALHRAHVDQIYMMTERLLNQMETRFDPSGLFAQAQRRLAEADSAYTKMEYVDALQLVLAAYQLARQANETTAPVIMVYTIGGVAVGVVVAALGFAVIRRAAHSKGSVTTQFYTQGLIHCSSCGNEIRPQALYCRHCGAKQL